MISLYLDSYDSQVHTHWKNRPLVSTCNGVETMAEKFYHLKFVLVSKSCEALLSMSGQRSPIDYPFQAIKFRHNSDSPFSYLAFDCSTQNDTFN